MNELNTELTNYYNEIFTNDYLLKYGYYSYKKNRRDYIEDYPTSDVFYHRLFNFDEFLTKINISRTRVQADVWTEPTYFNVPKTDLLRRQYKLPNLYSYIKLSKFIVANKAQFISKFIDNKQSTSKYFDSKILNFERQKEVEKQLLFNGKKRLTTDLSNFYPTLYTHSIPWMILGKWESKRTFQTTQSSFENRLDKLIQLAQYGETHGVPTGSLVTRIIAELYMCYFDKRMFDDGFIYKRYVDDFIFSFNSEEQQNNFLEKFNLICRENNLLLNSEKTGITSFPFNDLGDKTDLFNYLELRGFYSLTDNLLRRKILKEYIDFCIKEEFKGNKGSCKIIFSGLDIAFSKAELSEDEVADLLLYDNQYTNFNLLEYLIDLTFKRPELSNRLLYLLDDNLRSHKSRIKEIFKQYIYDHAKIIEERIEHFKNNKFDLELYEILLYFVLFIDDVIIFDEETLLGMIDNDVDDYSLCLITIIYLKNNFNESFLLEKIKVLLETSHGFYETDRARMTEKNWFFRYFVYSIIKNIDSLNRTVQSNYAQSELNWAYISTLGNSTQSNVTRLYDEMLNQNVKLVNCGINFDFQY